MRLSVCAPCGLWARSSADAQQAQPAAVTVGTVAASRKPIARSADFVGRVEAIDRVEVKARVTGAISGAGCSSRRANLVKEGDSLYRIEKGLFQAAVEQAQGALERSKAAKILSTEQLQRAEDLYRQAGRHGSGAGSGPWPRTSRPRAPS